MQMQSTFRYSHHAICRIAQRGISSVALQLILEHGETFYAGRGCSYVQLSKATLRRLSAEGVPESILRRTTSLQAVVSEEGEVVTCYHASSRRLGSSRRQPSHKYH